MPTGARAGRRGTWDWIVQEGRAIERAPSWDDPVAYARAVQASQRRNKWAGQPTRIIVVSEKGAVRGTFAPVLEAFEVDFLPVGGYASATRVHELAQLDRGSQALLLPYLGDHDPSGRGMSDSDLPRRLARYASDNPADRDWWDEEIESAMADMGLAIRRIALTCDKVKNTRHPWFVEHYGEVRELFASLADIADTFKSPRELAMPGDVIDTTAQAVDQTIPGAPGAGSAAVGGRPPG